MLVYCIHNGERKKNQYFHFLWPNKPTKSRIEREKKMMESYR